MAGRVWRSCPYLALDDPYLAVGSLLADAAEFQPLTGWPTLYSFGMQCQITALRNCRTLKRQRDQDG